MAKNNEINKKINRVKGNKANPDNKMKKSRNIWKILAIVFVALFIIIMAVGIFRSPKFREHPQQLTASQIDNVKSIALSDMNSRGDMIANYTINTPGIVRIIYTAGIKRNVTEVAIYNVTVRDMYIIDLDTGQILVYSKTEFFDGLNHLNDDKRMGDNVNPNQPPGSPRTGGFLGR